MIDADKIIQDTLKVFTSTPALEKKFNQLKDYVYEDDYKLLHPQPLTKTKLKINVFEFVSEIEKYQTEFVQWGKHNSEQPRYGLALVNQDGKLKGNKDPINGSLYEWNSINQERPIIESDCTTPTEVMDLESLKCLRIFDGHWSRSNILKWQGGAGFTPHIDNVIPCPWLRLWATTNSDVEVGFYNKETKEITPFENIEEGVVYIIDTSIVHNGYLKEGVAYQLFLSIMPSALSILKEQLL